MTTPVLSLSEETSCDNVFFVEIISTLKAIKSSFERSLINRILHLLLFHMKFLKLAKGLFDKSHMKLEIILKGTLN